MTNNPYSPEAMRAKFWELTRAAEEIRSRSLPLRAERDKIIADTAPRLKKLEREYKDIEAPLYEIERERALLARALGGKTGQPPESVG